MNDLPSAGNLDDALKVKVSVPTDGSSAQTLHHAPWTGVLSGHDLLEFCRHAVNHAHHWLSLHKLLEQQDLTSANDWYFYGTFWEHECAFRSPSPGVLAIFDSRSGAFVSFVGCMVRQGRVYRHLSERLGGRLFAKIVMATATRAGAPTQGNVHSWHFSADPTSAGEVR
jgi:hypothetical protein